MSTAENPNIPEMTAPEATAVSVPEAVTEPVPEAGMPEFVAEPVPEAVAEPVPEAVAEPVPEAVAEPLPEVGMPEFVAEPVPETVAEPVPETVAEPLPEAGMPELITQPAEETQSLTEEQQAEAVHQLRLRCDIRDLSSILDTWNAFLSCGYEERFYAAYIGELNTAILSLIGTTKDPVALQSMRDQLSGDPVRFEKHIGRLNEKLQAIDLSQRTYRGIVFDSPEAMELAKQEEKRLEAVMRGLSRDSLDSIDAAIAQVNTSPSPIKKMYLDTLHSLRLELVQKGCSFRGVLYESPAHAEHARQIYAWAQNIYNSIDRSNEVSVKAAREHLASANHKAAQEFIDQLDKILTELDIQKRTVDGVVFETAEQADIARQELPWIRGIMSGIRTDDEASLLEAKARISECTTAIRDKYLKIITQQLTEYDIRVRTFRGKVYDTREEASLLRHEASRIREILGNMNQSNEASLLEAKAALDALTTELRDAPLATVTNLLHEYDIRLRTFNGVLYDTREEAIAVAQEFQVALSIRQQVDPENEQTILDALAAMERLNTSVKDVHLSALKSMWEAYDTKQRTFGNILFETREEASLARSTYQTFMTQFNSMDLEQSANLVILEQYINETLQEKLRDYATGLVNDVRTVHTRIAYILRTDATIDVETQKKESADLYHFIVETIPMMTKYRFRTENMEALKKKHFASLNMGKKLLNFFKK